MIGKLRGVVDSYGDDFVILDVNGVGYVVTCSARTLQNLPRPGEVAALAIETQMREDSIRLFGFGSEAERDWFRLLQSVQGVGAKVALALQGVLGEAELALAIARQDKAAISRAPGIGPRLAARILVELKDKAPALAVEPASATAGDADNKVPPAVSDAVSALVNLGYGRPQAAAAVAVSAAALGEGAATSELIRRSLRELSR
ncbi:Holliday junction branch migration protein RuvA [Methylocapsa palsarum]|uniref:Holliday junction branch migration complex subunit RuvA n=1 Tax=Methylocapsa palsarum TaxID=1612308 RepID=A0A1I3WCR7_9HYPH|nr:Holliday junction branch migration protein RuvA [Methylocapsa palsarum]SFK04206.1 holliday junction DNA helicase RuvA [Methylocapsa palsarum]